jgi:NitT/TauT family transport system ATP-binding protein
VTGTLIAAENVEKVYRGRTGIQSALQPISLEIGEGEFVSILGPSGCGKTTFLKIVAGLIPATGGQVSIAGVPVTEPPDQIGVVFQAPTLLRWRTVLDNVLVPAEARGFPCREYVPVARELIRLVGLEGFSDHYPRELSGGMQQRVALSRALLLDPRLLLMDEPFGALDAMTREEMNLELQRIWGARAKTVLFITHSIDEAVFLSDRVVVMTARPGRILDTLAIDLPRPRTIHVRRHPRFIEYVDRIRTLIFARL